VPAATGGTLNFATNPPVLLVVVVTTGFPLKYTVTEELVWNPSPVAETKCPGNTDFGLTASVAVAAEVMKGTTKSEATLNVTMSVARRAIFILVRPKV